MVAACLKDLFKAFSQASLDLYQLKAGCIVGNYMSAFCILAPNSIEKSISNYWLN
jgi:hypothetical protein